MKTFFIVYVVGDDFREMLVRAESRGEAYDKAQEQLRGAYITRVRTPEEIESELNARMMEVY